MSTADETNMPVDAKTSQSSFKKGTNPNYLRGSGNRGGTESNAQARNKANISFEQEGDMLGRFSSELDILGATQQALEGLIIRGGVSNLRLLTSRKIKKEKEEPDDSRGIELNDRTFYERVQDALTELHGHKRNTSMLGAPKASVDVPKFHRSSGIYNSFRETYVLDHDIPLSTGTIHGIRGRLDKKLTKAPVKSDLATKNRNIWKPKNCQLKYTTPYPMPYRAREKVEEVAIKQIEKSQDVYLNAAKKSWCGCCMREAVEPYSLPCGHSFCKRCIANTHHYLMQDNAKSVKDTRAVMRCPLRHCRATIPCLPLTNGDFRFHLVRPEDKVPVKAETLNLCEQHRLTTYKIRIDVDMTKRKSDDLFDRFCDVIIEK